MIRASFYQPFLLEVSELRYNNNPTNQQWKVMSMATLRGLFSVAVVFVFDFGFDFRFEATISLLGVDIFHIRFAQFGIASTMSESEGADFKSCVCTCRIQRPLRSRKSEMTGDITRLTSSGPLNLSANFALIIADLFDNVYSFLCTFSPTRGFQDLCRRL